MSTDVSIITVDNNDNLIFNVPLKMDEYEINPSNGGVLANGVPYQGSGGTGPTGSRDYIAIKKTVNADVGMEGPFVFKMDYNAVKSKKRVFMYLDPPLHILPGQNNFIDEAEYNVIISGVDQYAPPFTPIFYTNMYSTNGIMTTFVNTSTPDFLRYTVKVSYQLSVNIYAYLWMKPADCGLFMEFIT